jgi:hypothetical protein
LILYSSVAFPVALTTIVPVVTVQVWLRYSWCIHRRRYTVDICFPEAPATSSCTEFACIVFYFKLINYNIG